MLLQSRRPLALLCCVVLAACGDGTGSRLFGTAGSSNAATVRFVNATASPLDLAVNGIVSPANANIAPGGGVGCFVIDDATAPALTVRQAGSPGDLSGFAPTFPPGGRFTVVAFPGPGVLVQFASLPSAGTVTPGRSMLRVFNGSPGLGTVDVYVTLPGAALGTASGLAVAVGTASVPLDVTPGAVQIRLTSTNTTTVVFDAGSRTLAPGVGYVLVVSGATTAVLVPDC